MIIDKFDLFRVAKESQREYEIDRKIARRQEMEEEHQKQRFLRELGERLFGLSNEKEEDE
jgi:hypothetical protein